MAAIVQIYPIELLRDSNRRLVDYLPGKEISCSVSAPGIGKVTYKITRIDHSGMWGYVVKNDIRDLEPWEVF
jgi:hypothetical protein